MTFDALHQEYRFALLWFKWKDGVDVALEDMREKDMRRLIEYTDDWEELRNGKEAIDLDVERKREDWDSFYETVKGWEWVIDRKKVKANLFRYHKEMGFQKPEDLSEREWLGETK